MLDGFSSEFVATPAGRLFVRRKGEGPPLLLIHGYPQNHVMWHRVAPALAERYAVVLVDLPGYGASDDPARTADHAAHSKRATAASFVHMMEALGHTRFLVAGHDRGARVTYRLALDHPTRVIRAACLDIVPTVHMWERANAGFVVFGFHWGFLAQDAPMPETLIGAAPDAYFDHLMVKWTGGKVFAPEALAAYRAAFRTPKVIAASCEDYRAGATIDWALDREDRAAGRKIACPLLALWGKRTYGGELEPILNHWRELALDVRGAILDCGHFLPEEAPEATRAALDAFFGEVR